ncbi:hypothetical protein [Halobacillus litoralis]|uniref:hypothetical protein n=1 Tax=Halobacillus litoralis TaxID=45668 RepID=UPI001CFC9023|nr:hypothetical protein [Halobacillus litoralis]
MLVFLLPILLLAGCIQQSENVQVLTAAPDDYELYLYTEPEKENEAQNYLSALLDWKLKQQVHERLEFKQTETHADKINVPKEELPLLVVKQKGKTVTKIAGNTPRDKILTTLEDTIIN